MENIVDTVCTVTEVAPEKVYSKSRLPAVSEAKLLIRFYMYETLLHLTSMNSMTEFLTKGRNDDHSIVLRSQKLVKVALEGRDEWAHKITEYVYKIDEQLNQIHVSDESNSSYRPRRKR
jgi:chromosomal replication initiation ATPase DnaA